MQTIFGIMVLGIVFVAGMVVGSWRTNKLWTGENKIIFSILKESKV